MRLYLDACAIIYSVEGSPTHQAATIAAMQQAAPAGILITSQLSRIECRALPVRQNKSTLLATYDLFLTRRSLIVAGISRAIIDEATLLRANYNLKTADAIHVATALLLKADRFLTGDQDLARVRSLNVQIV